MEGRHLAPQGPTLQVRGPVSGNKPLATGEGAQMGTQGAACGIPPSVDEWVRGTEARGPFIMQADVRVDISLGVRDRAILLSTEQGKLQPGPDLRWHGEPAWLAGQRCGRAWGAKGRLL